MHMRIVPAALLQPEAIFFAKELRFPLAGSVDARFHVVQSVRHDEPEQQSCGNVQLAGRCTIGQGVVRKKAIREGRCDDERNDEAWPICVRLVELSCHKLRRSMIKKRPDENIVVRYRDS